uniref:PEHE domain-containing protein n=1 Tax=Anopheles atroparvus TaxID=41427 RepID=A0AAG5CU41_ANOAO
MGLAAAAKSVSTITIRSDAVEEMAPALTEPLSQSKLSSSAASGASPRTSSSTTTTATVTATLGGTTLLPLADVTLSTEQQQQQQQQVQEAVEVVVDQQQEVVVQQGQPNSVPVEGFVGIGAAAPTIPSSSSYVAGTLHCQEAPLDGMGMSLPVTSGDGGSTTVDDIQNNNSAGGGGQMLLKQLDQDSNRDLVEIALEQLHHDVTIAEGEEGRNTSVDGATAMDAIAGAVVDMGTVTAPVDGVPENVLQPASTGGHQQCDFVLMDINSTPVILPQPTLQEQQAPLQPAAMIGAMGPQHQQDLSQSSTSSLGGVGSVGGAGGAELGGLMKESTDMDQMIRELSTADIDLLQVLKSFDNNSLLLFSDVDVANLCDVGPVDGRDGHAHPSTSSPSSSPNKDRERLELHAEIVKRQAQMQRKYDFLVRRLHKVVARYMGQHVSEEVAGLFEHTQRYWKKREKEHAKQLHNSNSSGSAGGNNTSATALTEKWPDIIPFQAPPVDNTPASPEQLKPISANALKTFAKRVEGISTTICSVQSKAVLHNRYFHGVNNSDQKPAPPPPSSGVPSASTSFGVGGAENNASAASVTAGSAGTGSGARTTGYANISNTIPLFDRVATQELEQTAGLLHAELRHVQNTIDSDATLSSSGGDSADESMPYVNALQEPLTITERASWKWSKDRAAIASRWTWLVARIADLEYRIRQHSEVLNKIRAKKGPVVFEEPPVGSPEDPQQPQPQPPQSINGYRGQLPGSSKPSDASDPTATATTVATDEEEDVMASCSRARPYCRLRFRKRKLLPTHNLHVISKRAARPSNFKCGCQWPLHPCALCTGRQDPTAPRDPPDTMPFAERIALLDPCYHSVLSFPEDISHSIHLEAIMRLPEWQNKMIRSTPVPAVPVGVSSSSSAQKGTSLPGTSARGVGRGDPNSSFFSSGDETAPSAHGKRYTGSDGKRKYPNSSNKYKSNNERSITTDSGNRSKKAKSRRDVILQNSRKSGSGYLPDGSRMAGPNGHSRNHKNKSRKSSHCYDYYDGHDGVVSRSKNSSPTPNQRNERRPRNSYDIDNIVIPYSMAAATRVSLPQYKDIAIPKWRIVDDHDEAGAALSADGEAAKLDPATDASQCSTSSSTVSASERPDDDKEPLLKRPREPSIPPNGTKTTVKAAVSIGASGSGYARKEDPLPGTQGTEYHLNLLHPQQQQQQQLFVMPALDEEDISDEAIMLKHERALQEERKKFRTYMKFPWSRPRANRRTESRAGSSGGNTPDPTSPAPPTPMVEHDSSPACPSTPLTPQDGQELSEANVINALNKSLTKKERRRTVSSKREEQNQAAGVGGGTTTPDTREVVSPYEPLQFPLADDIFENMVRSMPNDHIAMVEDCISKLTGHDGLPLRRSHQRNNNVLLMLKSSVGLAPASLGLGRNQLSSSASCSSTTLSANEADQEEFDDEDLMLAKRTEHQIIMERLLNSRGESQQYEIVPPTAKPMLGDDDEDAIDDEETDTGESLFVEEDDPNDPEWHDRPVGGARSGGGPLGAAGRT